MALNEVPAEPVADPQGALEVDPGARVEVPEPGPVERCADDVRREATGHHGRNREAHPIHGHALTGGQIRVGALDGEVEAPIRWSRLADRADLGHDSDRKSV